MQRSYLALILALFAASCPPGSATTLVAVAARDLVLESAQIVHVKCTDAECYRVARGLLVTRYTFDVTETLLGSHEARLRFVLPGGERDGIATIIPGISRHQIGDELVLFLPDEPAAGEFRLPIGLDQGVYRVDRREDERGVTTVVARSLAGIHLETGRRRDAAPEQFPEQVEVETFKQAVRAKIAELRR